MTLEERIANLKLYGTGDISPCQAPIQAVRDYALAIIDAQSKQLEDLAWEYERIIENIGRKDEKDGPNP